MGKITDAREALKTALLDAGWIVYGYPAENMSTPCVVLVPGGPYVEIKSLGTDPKLGISFNVTLCVAANDNQAALINLENLIEQIIPLLPRGSVGANFTQPKITQVGPSDLLTTDIQLDIALI
jgi:hypothetical protein